MRVECRGEGMQARKVLADEDRQTFGPGLDYTDPVAAGQVLVDRCGQALVEPPQIQVSGREVERVDLALPDEQLARDRVEQHGFIRRRLEAVEVAAAGDDQTQTTRACVRAVPERALPVREQ